MEKVKGEENPADLMTKFLPYDKIKDMLGRLGCHLESGRNETAPKLVANLAGARFEGECETTCGTVNRITLKCPTPDGASAPISAWFGRGGRHCGSPHA